MKSLLVLPVMLALSCVGPLLAAQTVVRGVVVDKDGNPVPGTRISLEKSETSAITDLDGAFELTLPDGKTGKLVFNCAGMLEKKVRVSDFTGKAAAETSVTLDDASDDAILGKNKPAEKTVVLTKRTWWNKEPDHVNCFVLYQMPLFSSQPFSNIAPGGMICVAKNFGGYLRFNYRQDRTEQESMVSTSTLLEQSWLTGKTHYNTILATAGFVARLGKTPLYAYVGGGYGRFYAIYDVQAPATPLTYEYNPCVAIDGGLIIKLWHICITGGLTYIPGKLHPEGGNLLPSSNVFLPTIGLGVVF